ncbi:MAG: HD-GYP domain-containing protein [Longimicrobiales bacterium]
MELRHEADLFGRDEILRWDDWVSRLEAWDPHLTGHATNVARFSEALARSVDCGQLFVDAIRVAALLHDVGKLRVPPHVLGKPGPLSDTEWDLVRRHPVTGERMVAGLGLPRIVRQTIRHHHEHWDGCGYPDRLRGTEIPLAARILCVADVFDALTSERSYHTALQPAEALAVMRVECGTVLDPDLFFSFEAMMAGTGATAFAA